MSGTPADPNRKLRVAAPGDTELRVLVSGLELPPWSERIELRETRSPRELERALEAGDLDGAVLPIDAVARAGGAYELVPGLAAGSAGPCGVMVLAHREPLDRIDTVASTGRGHAAESLARMLFAASGSRVGLQEADLARSRLTDASGAEQLPPGTALLLTGDLALVSAPAWQSAGWRVVDLGEAWYELTGLPFVWAAWAVRPGTVTRRLYGILHGARTRGKRGLADAIEALAASTPGARDRVDTALSRWIRYRLGNRELAGVRRFWNEAAAVGLLPTDAPLRLLPLAAGTGCQTPETPG